jgi:hypothetical protein
MDVARLVILAIALLLLAFTLGAVIAWRLEGRDQSVLPLWLVITRNVSWLALVAYLVAGDPPTGVVSVDPLAWAVIEALMVIASLVVFGLELRHTLAHRAS